MWIQTKTTPDYISDSQYITQETNTFYELSLENTLLKRKQTHSHTQSCAFYCTTTLQIMHKTFQIPIRQVTPPEIAGEFTFLK